MSIHKLLFTLPITWFLHLGLPPFNSRIPGRARFVEELYGVKIRHFTRFTYASYKTLAIFESIAVVASAYPGSRLSLALLSVLFPNWQSRDLYISTAAAIGMILVAFGTLLRIQSFAELGKYFTWEIVIQEDHKLVTTGPYSIVRHPAYSGSTFRTLGVLVWYASRGSWIRESQSWAVWVLGIPCLFIGIGTPAIVIATRVHVEDEALKEMFGEEWKKWSKRVRWRVIPWIY